MASTVLIVDDDAAVAETVASGLQDAGYPSRVVASAALARELLRVEPMAVALVDVLVGEEDGLALCRWADVNCPRVPIVMMAEQAEIEVAIQAIRAGAYDFVPKPLAMDSLLRCVERALEAKSLRDEVQRLRSMTVPPGNGRIIGQSRPMKKVFRMIEQVADSDATVLITGESGTGKELVARAIHERSERSEHPFVAINCAAISPTLLESELFGHVKGAFTGARHDHDGVFVQASGGTLFLDEIGEMPFEMQAKLLRVLQECRVRPVGGDRDLDFDTRILSATNRDLEAQVENGRFREDLYYRVNVVGIELPPLRSRGDDVLKIAQFFIEAQVEASGKNVRGFSPDTAKKLLAYDWPGNVRELENAIEHAITMTHHDTLVPDDLPARIRDFESSKLVFDTSNPDDMPSLEEMERRYLRRVLQAVRGNKTHAARVLDISRRTLYRKMERLGVDDDFA